MSITVSPVTQTAEAEVKRAFTKLRRSLADAKGNQSRKLPIKIIVAKLITKIRGGVK